MYRDENAALNAQLDALRDQLAEEKRQRTRAEAEAEQSRLIARFVNPRPMPRALKLTALSVGVAGLLVVATYMTFRAANAEAIALAAEQRALETTAQWQMCDQQAARLSRLCGQHLPEKRYATVGPSWIHAGLDPLVPELQRCQQKHAGVGGQVPAETIYIKGAAQDGKLAHAGLIGASPGTPLARCLLEVLRSARFSSPPGRIVPFHYAFYLH